MHSESTGGHVQKILLCCEQYGVRIQYLLMLFPEMIQTNTLLVPRLAAPQRLTSTLSPQTATTFAVKLLSNQHLD